MLKQVLKIAVAGVMSLGFLFSTAEAQTVTAIPKLDLNQYMGKWYELAHLPNKPEKECISDAVVLYAPADKPNRFQVVNSCEIKNGNSDARDANGSPADKLGDGKLKVSYIWPFSSKYWVLATGPSYEWMLVGSPNHKTLLILSRTSTLKPEVLAEIQAKAASERFATAKLVMVSQRH